MRGLGAGVVPGLMGHGCVTLSAVLLFLNDL